MIKVPSLGEVLQEELEESIIRLASTFHQFKALSLLGLSEAAGMKGITRIHGNYSDIDLETEDESPFLLEVGKIWYDTRREIEELGEDCLILLQYGNADNITDDSNFRNINPQVERIIEYSATRVESLISTTLLKKMQ